MSEQIYQIRFVSDSSRTLSTGPVTTKRFRLTPNVVGGVLIMADYIFNEFLGKSTDDHITVELLISGFRIPDTVDNQHRFVLFKLPSGDNINSIRDWKQEGIEWYQILRKLASKRKNGKALDIFDDSTPFNELHDATTSTGSAIYRKGGGAISGVLTGGDNDVFIMFFGEEFIRGMVLSASWFGFRLDDFLTQLHLGETPQTVSTLTEHQPA